jgi:Outer membrane protein beta-barrel domain
MTRRNFTCCRWVLAAVIAVGSLASPAQAQSTGDSKFVLDLGVGLDKSINGNVNSGAIGRLQGQAAAILPQPYGDVYGTGLTFKFGGGYVLNPEAELRAVFTLQSADANLVRLGDLGPSSLYGQYSDYVSFGLDLGYRRYVPLSNTKLRIYGEGTLGLAFIDEINVLLSAPQSNLVTDQTDFYDRTAAFTWGINFGMLFPVASKVDLNAQIGFRHVSGLSEVDQLVGTGLEEINNDSSRLTFPIVIGVRFRF